MAFDEAEKSDDGDDSAFAARIAGYLSTQFSSSELHAVITALQQVIGVEGAQDEPPDFPGKPLVGGGNVPHRPNNFVGPGNSNGRAAAKYPGTFSQPADNPAGNSERGFAGPATTFNRDVARNRLEVLSMDAARRASYAEAFPDAARIAQDDGFGKQPAPKAKPMTTAASNSYAEMFPGAENIKHT
jgi:hypothetical protein